MLSDMSRKAAVRFPVFAAGLMLALALLPACQADDGGSGNGTVTLFSDGSSGWAHSFDATEGAAMACITLPRTARITGAGISIAGAAGAGGEFPLGARLELGGRPLWSFAGLRTGAGGLGCQTYFSDSVTETDLFFGPGGGVTTERGIVLPREARITSAALSVSGGEDSRGIRELYGGSREHVNLAWSSRGTVIEAKELNGTVRLSELEPSTGRVLASWVYSFGPGAYLADFHYDVRTDTSALLLPGRGVALVGPNGTARECFTDRANSIIAMSFGGSWLAVLRPDGADVLDIGTGTVSGFNASAFPGALRGMPRAADYHPASGRLFVAWQDWEGTGVTQMNLSSGTFSVRTEQKYSGELSCVLFVPALEKVFVGYRYIYKAGENVQVVNPVRVLDISTGEWGDYPAFEGLSGIARFNLAGGRAFTVGYLTNTGWPEAMLVRLDISDGSWRTYKVALPIYRYISGWSHDPAGERLLVSTGEERWLFELERNTASIIASMDVGRPAGPALVTGLRELNGTIYAGTEAGAVAFRHNGSADKLFGGGLVTAMDLDRVAGVLAAGTLEGWHLDPSLGIWRYSDAVLTACNVTTGNFTSWRFPLKGEWWDARVSAVQLDMARSRLYFGIAGDYTSGGLLELDMASGLMTNLTAPTLSVTSLAMSVDKRTLYVGCAGEEGGLFVLDTSTKNHTLLPTMDMGGTLGTHITSLFVDDSGKITVGQGTFSRTGGYALGGVTVISPDLKEERSYYATLTSPVIYYDVQSVARDPVRGRLFLGLGVYGDILIIDEATNATHYIGRGAGSRSLGVVHDLDWSSGTGTLSGASWDIYGTGSISGFTLRWDGRSPENVSVDVGADDLVELSQRGPLGNAGPADIKSALEAALARAPRDSAFVEIPVKVQAGSAGQVRMGPLSVAYELGMRIDFSRELDSYISAQDPGATNVTVPLSVRARGGQLRLWALNVTYEHNDAPKARKIKDIRLDAGGPNITVLDIAPYFRDDHDARTNLSYDVKVTGSSPGVDIGRWSSHYMIADARYCGFRGDVKVTVTATDSGGLSTNTTFTATVYKGGEYIPPPPYYWNFLWIMGIVLGTMGVMAVYLYFRVFRRKKE